MRQRPGYWRYRFREGVHTQFVVLLWGITFVVAVAQEERNWLWRYLAANLLGLMLGVCADVRHTLRIRRRHWQRPARVSPALALGGGVTAALAIVLGALTGEATIWLAGAVGGLVVARFL